MYFLNTPGYTVGYVSALARVTLSLPSFVLLAGDAIYHPGELRPSRYLLLPTDIIPDPFAPDLHPLESHYGCPGGIFDALFAGHSRPVSGPVYGPAVELPFVYDADKVLRTVEKL